jgi:serine-type D-Ala-D-Ala carboxypeptidase (penicillin-binding protein 5/6)
LKKPRNRYKRRLTLLFLVLVPLICVSYFTFRDANGEDSAVSEIQSKDSPSSLQSSLELSSHDLSYVLLDPQTNRLLRASNADTQRAPASTTKLLTGLIALKTLKETDIIRVGSEVNVDGSKLGLSPGDEITVHDLLTALYIHSANDAAAALAVKVSGSISAFAKEMNDYSSTLGCTHSNFTNPHGMPDPNHYTTANDLSIVARAFLNSPELMEFVKEANATVHWKDSHGRNRTSVVINTNSLLGVYPGDQGLKTGTTTEAGQCLVSYVSRPDGKLLLVLLGSKQRYNDSIKLLDEGWTDQRISSAVSELSKDPRGLLLSPGIY